MVKVEAYSVDYLNKSRLMSYATDKGGQWQNGAIATQFGFCNCYLDAQSWSISFIWMGNEYRQSGREKISELALTRRANKFAKAIVGQSMLNAGDL